MATSSGLDATGNSRDDNSLHDALDRDSVGDKGDSTTYNAFVPVQTLIARIETAIEQGSLDELYAVIEQCKDDYERAEMLASGLSSAAKHGKLDLVEKLLVEGADPAQPCWDGESAVVAAVKRDHCTVVKILLENDFCRASSQAQASDGSSLLELAALSEDMIAILQDHGAEFNDKDDLGLTGLMRTRSLNVAKRFVLGGCEVHEVDQDGMNALLLALKYQKSPALLRYLLQEASVDPTSWDSRGRSAWHHFMGCDEPPYGAPWDASNLIEVAEILDQAGCDRKAKAARDNTPLHHTTMEGRTDLLEVLLRNGDFSKEDMNAFNHDGRTVLHLAVRYEHLELAKKLLELGADPNIQPWDQSPLHYAVTDLETPDLRMVELLINGGGDVNLQNIHGQNALHFACSNPGCSLDVLNTILSKVVDINVRDKNGSTALHVAAKLGNVETLQLLLSYEEINRAARDEQGWIPVYLASRRFEDPQSFVDCFAPPRRPRTKFQEDWFSMYERSELTKDFDLRAVEIPGLRRVFGTICLQESRMEDGCFNWLHIHSRNPDLLYDALTVRNFAINSTHSEVWMEAQALMHIVDSSSFSEHAQAICSRRGIVEVHDFGDINPDDHIQTIAIPFPCFYSSVDRTREQDSEEQLAKEQLTWWRTALGQLPNIQSEVLAGATIWLFVVHERCLISTFPHTPSTPFVRRDQLHDAMRASGGAAQSTIELSLKFAAVCSKNSEVLATLRRFTSIYAERKEHLTTQFERAVFPAPGVKTTNQMSGELFEINDETDLTLKLQALSQTLQRARSFISSQERSMTHLIDGLVRIGDIQNIEMYRQLGRFNSIVRSLNDQLQKISEMQNSASETNQALLVLLDLKQRQANAIEARSAREQSVLARHQNQTLMVFTIVTVIFLPLSFIAAFLAINITELPHDSNGNQRMSLAFVLRYVLGPGLGCAMFCVLVAFSGTIKRSLERIVMWSVLRIFLWPRHATSKLRIADEEHDGANWKVKEN